ncbi:MAG: hypothetical protein AAF725_09755 [Acidobacteriota bacterium]
MPTQLSRRAPVRRASTPRALLPALLIVFASGLCALPAAADSGVSLGLTVGVGGSPDGDEFSGLGFQLSASWEWRLNTLAQLRVGGLDLDLDRDNGGTLQPAEMTFISLATEYRHNADFYDAGVIIGVGFYRLESDSAFGSSGFLAGEDESSIGLHAGVSGHFDLTDTWSVPVEILVHYADFDQAQLFITAQAGIAYSF